jgi:hypothetical protein
MKINFTTTERTSRLDAFTTGCIDGLAFRYHSFFHLLERDEIKRDFLSFESQTRMNHLLLLEENEQFPTDQTRKISELIRSQLLVELNVHWDLDNHYSPRIRFVLRLDSSEVESTTLQRREEIKLGLWYKN